MNTKLLSLLFISILFFSCEKEEIEVPVPEFTIKTGKQTIISQGLEREYVLRIPRSYKKDTPMPVVFALHGRGENGSQAEKNSKLTLLGASEGFITIYPTALDDSRDKVSTWTSGRSITVDGKTYDDLWYLEHLIDFLQNNLNIDQKRIYLTGFSNGAFMTYKTAYFQSNLFAALAPISGWSQRISADRGPLRGPVPLLHIHGLNDSRIPAEGSNIPRGFFSAQEGVNYYITQNKASETPEILIDDANVNSRIWRAKGPDGADVQYIQAKNGVHEWFTKNNSGKFDLYKEIWKFFKDHPKK